MAKDSDSEHGPDKGQARAGAGKAAKGDEHRAQQVSLRDVRTTFGRIASRIRTVC
jgi:hypothetical protein